MRATTLFALQNNHRFLLLQSYKVVVFIMCINHKSLYPFIFLIKVFNYILKFKDYEYGVVLIKNVKKGMLDKENRAKESYLLFFDCLK